MKKFIAFSFLLLLPLMACQDLQPLPINKGNKVAHIGLPTGHYTIKNEADYQHAKSECRRRLAGRDNDNSDFCINELRWQRNYGALQFLGEEKPKPLFQN